MMLRPEIVGAITLERCENVWFPRAGDPALDELLQAVPEGNTTVVIVVNAWNLPRAEEAAA